ncbi:hypothetical protein GCM10025868_44940 [Angustibacter aerolatus]|uniref:Phospholipid/glycerol acyltransferase domain-containing protein n=1 Tax=Angustibacter aerolatus TaxID=1162965 RepID=A0ABQ6JPI7_9ACTN|nr:lysophospholipid acyltransferase family protein [Angustibacter aerolatus]GMA89244.1 hypothetical protein GCM10025868_44940 [Angustibacter aerolatus]
MSDGPDEAPTTRAALRGRWVGRFLFHVIWRGRVVDGQKAPSGPVLLASNHSGFLDGPLVFGLAPRPSHFLVKAEMFQGFLGRVLHWAGQIPIDRSGSDRRALQARARGAEAR